MGVYRSRNSGCSLGGMDEQGVKEDPPPQIIQKAKSWVAIAKEERILKKYDIEVSDSEGK